ncbi:FHA domain-containing protein [candidate division KSB1 bacterium]|nr:FHA domain-containing protein [candidate division KSB1 bacterium]
MSDDAAKIKITWEDLDKAEEIDPGQVQSFENQSWGTVIDNQYLTTDTGTSGGGSILLKSWFYLGAAGLMGAFLAWAICEPTFEDGYSNRGWGEELMFPLMAILICVNLGVVESLVERSWKRALLRGLAAIVLGFVLGYIFAGIGGTIFIFLTIFLVNMGAAAENLATNPIFWICRAIAWATFGMAGGLIFGIVSKSGKKASYGILGGAIGAFIGGLLFDPICLLTQGGEASRAIGMSIMGMSTGIAIGLVENALKDRWLYVSSGPLAGKQFILYQNHVTIGKAQSNMIFLFKDPSILECHATIEYQANKSIITAFGPVAVSGQPIENKAQRILKSGDIIQIGRYTFSYLEKERNSESL